MGHRRGKESRMPRQSSMNETESPDKMSLEALNAETNYELARCHLIRILNNLMIDQRVEINKSALAIATALNHFYTSGAADTVRLLQAAKVSVESNAELIRSKENWERGWQVKMAEIEARRHVSALFPFLPFCYGPKSVY